jgi:nucleoside-diphosphate-sugar epimerase
MSAGRRVGITGASGFVGSQLASRFEKDGWSVVRFSRGGRDAVPFQLGDAMSPEAFRSRDVGALVHCAYDFRPVRWAGIDRTNVEGSRRLIAAAAAGGVERIVVMSTISAFAGCRSLYGRAKLAIEADAMRSAGAVVRSGLVYGDDSGPSSGGMIGSLSRSARGRVVPLLGGGNQLQHLVHIDDLFHLVCRLCAAELGRPARPVVAASPRGWTVRELVSELARRQGNEPWFVSVPWQSAWLGLKAAELAGFRPAYRSDSVISLVYQDPHPDFASLSELGVSVRDFGAR